MTRLEAATEESLASFAFGGKKQGNNLMKLTLFAVAALMASASTAALAQVDVGVDAGAGVSVDSGSTSLNAGAAASAGANASGDTNGSPGEAEPNHYGSIISDLSTSTTEVADIESLDSDVQINVVTLSELRGNAGENSASVDKALSEHSSTVADLRTTIENDSELSTQVEAALSSEGNFSMADVVSIYVTATGELVLIVDDAE